MKWGNLPSRITSFRVDSVDSVDSVELSGHENSEPAADSMNVGVNVVGQVVVDDVRNLARQVLKKHRFDVYGSRLKNLKHTQMKVLFYFSNSYHIYIYNT
jgi:hypothetical protein